MTLPTEFPAPTPEGDLRSVPSRFPSVSLPPRPDHASLALALGGASRYEIRAELRGGIGDPYGDVEDDGFDHFRGMRER